MRGNGKIMENKFRGNSFEKLLKTVIAEETHYNIDDLNDRDSFEKIGIESVMMVSITKKLEKYLGDLPKTLFFEYTTIGELAQYLLSEYKSKIDVLFEVKKDNSISNEMIENDVERPVEIVVDSSMQTKVPMMSDCGNEVEIDSQLNDISEKQPQRQYMLSEIAGLISSEDTDEIMKPKGIKDNDIAIIGISGRFPMADDLEELWENIAGGKDCITEVPKELWDYNDYYSPEKGKPGKAYSKWGGFMRNIDKFDPLFFNISNIEANSMDPQERLFLETVYHTLEDAGYPRNRLESARVGVYVGAMWNQYQLYGIDNGDAGSFVASIANRVSYFFNFKGPSIGLDTMCSSSLTSVHLACQSILNGETNYAIAGGVNVCVHPNKYLYLSKTGFSSTDGRCRSFGEGGDGYVPGDGVGALLLKKASEAIKDGDKIYAIIKGSGINHGGKSNNYSAPNPKMQAELITKVFTDAEIDPATIDYMELHGTGTALGDPIEIRALTNVFKNYTNKKQFCPIGSIKSNIGHLEAAAGFSQIAKVILQFKNKKLVPSIHSDVLNSNINFKETPFYVQHKLVDWEDKYVIDDGVKRYIPRRSTVSSFGAGGSNAFMILEEYLPEKEEINYSQADDKNKKHIILLSAKSEERLHVVAENILHYLKNETKFLKYREDSDPKKISERFLMLIANKINVNIGLIDEKDSLQDFNIKISEVQQIVEDEFNVNLQHGLGELTDKRLSDIGEMIVQKMNQKKEIEWKKNTQRLLENVSYTLQVGREALNVRALITATNIEEVIDKITNFLNNSYSDKDILITRLSSKQMGISNYNEEDNLINDLIVRGRIEKLGSLWSKGYNIPWKLFYKDKKVKLLSLPLYPFEKERCWVDGKEKTKPLSFFETSSIGTLLITNENNKEVTFKKEIENVSIWELVRMLQSIGDRNDVSNTVLYNTHIDLSKGKNFSGTLFTSICNAESYISIKISLNLIDNVVLSTQYKKDNSNIPEISLVNLIKHYENNISSDEFYKAINATDETSTSMIIDTLDWEGNTAVVRYSLNGNINEMILLSLGQTINYHFNNLDMNNNYLDILEYKQYKEISDKGYIYITFGKYNEIISACVLNKDKEICMFLSGIAVDNSPQVLKDFFYEPVYDKLDKFELKEKVEPLGKSFIVYSDESEKIANMIMDCVGNDATQKIKLGISDSEGNINNEALILAIQESSEIETIYFLSGLFAHETMPKSFKEFAKTQEKGIMTLFTIAQELNKSGKKAKLKVFTNNTVELDKEGIQPISAPLVGFSKSIDKEMRTIEVEIIDLDLLKTPDEDLSKDLSIAVNGIEGAKHYLIRNNQIYEQKLRPVALEEKQNITFKDNGVYIIIGGSGTVGNIITDYLASNYNANIIWIGRKPQNEEISAKISKIIELGGTLKYYSVDISNEAGMKKVLQSIKKEHGKIHGIIHAAMDFNIQRISSLSGDDVKRGLNAKVYGGYVLEEITKNLELDFLIMFSSGESFTGNIGWAVYSAACNFKDALSRYINASGKRRSIIVNWGFWELADEQDNQMFIEKGIYPINAKLGTKALERIVSSEKTQVMAIHVKKHILKLMGVDVGDEDEKEIIEEKSKETKKLASTIVDITKSVAVDVNEELHENDIKWQAVSNDNLKQAVLNDLKTILSEALKIDINRIQTDVDLASYGIDSLMVTSVHKKLEEKMNKLPASLLLENETLNDVAEYLLSNKYSEMIRVYGIGAAENQDKQEQQDSQIPEEKITVLRILQEQQIHEFLNEYGHLYKSGELAVRENVVNMNLDKIYELAVGGLVHCIIPIENNDVEVFITGKGAPLLLISPIALTAPIWINQLEYFRKKYTLIIIHQPGYGLSKPIRETNTKGTAETLEKTLKKLSVTENVIIVASCFGSIVGAYMAKHYPKLVSKLCFVGGFYNNSDLPPVDLDNLKIEEFEQMTSKISMSIGADFDLVIEKLDEKKETDTSYLLNCKELLLNSQCANSLVALRYLGEMKSLSTIDWLTTMNQPILCITGNLDSVIPPKRSEKIVEITKYGQLINIEGSGHYPYLTHPDQFNKIISNFIETSID